MSGKRFTAQQHEEHRQRNAERSRRQSTAGREIGSIPPVQHPKRLAHAERSFRAFCDSYFPQTFTLPWSDDHLALIDRVEQTVIHGRQFAVAAPRASGKTTIMERAVLWALLTGRHSFVVLIGATADHAATTLANLKAELSGNDLLLADFPAACFPIHQLEGEARRCSGQLHHGQRTHIGWAADQIILPTIPGSPCSGALIRVSGITGSIRGMLHTRPDGTSIRPSLAIIDDPQTDESAKSLSQCAARLSTINGAIANLAGPGRPMAMLAVMTVIAEGDLADQLLNRDTHPEWHGERFRMVYAFPEAKAKWQEYADLRQAELAAGGDGSQATAYYREHRDEMDAGAKVAWPARKLPDEVSALQHAMNLRLADEAAFQAEYQNNPLASAIETQDQLTLDTIFTRIGTTEPGEVPDGLDRVTAFIDVQQTSLWYVIAAWGQGFSGAIVDYGVWPEQGQRYFTLRSIRRTMQDASPDAGLEAALRHALDELTSQIIDREYRRTDGAVLHCERVLIDAAWGQSTDPIYSFIRESRHPTILMPAFGRGVRASDNPMSEWAKKKGDLVGFNWRIRTPPGSVRYVAYDANFWRSHIAARLTTPVGDPGALTLPAGTEQTHRMLAEHLTSEYRVRTQGRGRTVDEWKLRPGRDNHFWDSLVGTAVAASMLGVAAAGTTPTPARRAKRPRRRLQVSYE